MTGDRGGRSLRALAVGLRGSTGRALLGLVEAAGIAAGLVLASIALGSIVGGRLASERSLAAFDDARAQVPSDVAPAPSDGATVDRRLWSPGRIEKYLRSLALPAPAPLAILRIPSLGLEVPVLPGTDDLTLDRGTGHIAGTAPPGESGNVGIAGHRDGFFRGLKDLEVGSRIELETLGGRREYQVESLSVVEPSDVQVLEATPRPAVTLVTCFPFYYVGKAPQRFIVRAYETSSDPPLSSTGAAER